MHQQFHIGKDGTPKRCKAQPGHCRLAGTDGHFSTVKEAEDYLNEKNAELFASGAFIESEKVVPHKKKQKMKRGRYGMAPASWSAETLRANNKLLKNNLVDPRQGYLLQYNSMKIDDMRELIRDVEPEDRPEVVELKPVNFYLNKRIEMGGYPVHQIKELSPTGRIISGTILRTPGQDDATETTAEIYNVAGDYYDDNVIITYVNGGRPTITSISSELSFYFAQRDAIKQVLRTMKEESEQGY